MALILLAALTVFAAFLLYAFWFVYTLWTHLPDVSHLADLNVNTATTVVSSDGVVLATLETQNRIPVSLSEISPFLIQATLATEDSRFYEHGGVDARGIARALWDNLRAGNPTAQGASTLTQQLARNVFLSSDKTFRRKIEEVLLARKIESVYSKSEILEMYLNKVYYGDGNYGIEAASRAYFGKSARNLTLDEAALLAGLPQRPAAYSPTRHPEAALRRRAEVLDRMVATGAITAAQRAQADAAPLHVRPPHPLTMADWKAPYFVTHVLKLMREAYGVDYLYSGLKVETTLNWRMQQAAEKALRRGLHSGWGANTGALVALDPRSGDVRALVGGPDFRHNQFNAITQGVRQPGSAFKPLVYAAAFDTGICNLWTMVDDTKLVYPALPHDWVVHNYEDTYRGPVSVVDALRHSINTVAVQVCQRTQPDTVIYYAQRLGLTTPLTANLPLALGASGVRPLELCSAYSAFASGGNRYDPAFVTRITDAQGRMVYEDNPQARFHPNFLQPRTLDQINIGLREVVLSGTGTAAASIPDAHGKTGTTSSHRDAWFVGYTADLVTAVWAGHAHKETHRDAAGHKNVQTAYLPMPGATGGRLCAPIWTQFMAAALPLQQASNRSHGLASSPIAAPTLEELHQTLLAVQQAAAQKLTQDGTTDPNQADSPDNDPAYLSPHGRGGPHPLPSWLQDTTDQDPSATTQESPEYDSTSRSTPDGDTAPSAQSASNSTASAADYDSSGN